MATSGTYAFNPSLGEITIHALNSIGVRGTAILQEHLQSARMAANMVCSRWSAQGVNLWAVDLVTVPLVAGTATYDVGTNTITMLDAYVTIDDGVSDPIDRIILPVSRTEYASYPNKEQQGFTTVFWFDRLLSPTVTLWPVPDGTSAQYLKYYRVRQIQDTNLTNAQQVEVPYYFLEAFVYALAYRLAAIWAPDRAQGLKMLADEAYNIAAAQNIEQSDFYILPMTSGYFRP
jgi:hypothetical protein